MHRRSCGSLRRRIFRHGASTWNVLVAVVRDLKKAFASVDAIKHENRRTFVCAILWPRQLCRLPCLGHLYGSMGKLVMLWVREEHSSSIACPSGCSYLGISHWRYIL